MRKIVSIIIPFKKESEKQLGIILGSINSQIEVDFNRVEIILINDGGESININKFSIFENLCLKYYEIENVGPGLARQYGIDHSSSEYLMFMDADDMLLYGLALRDFFVAYKEKKYEIIIGRFMEQCEDLNNQFYYVTHDAKDWSAVYAKWFKRSYIESLGLRFHPDLRIYEDMYFVGLACSLATNIAYMDKVVYAWLCDKNSIMRTNNSSANSNLHTYALQHRLFLEKLREKRPKKYRESIVSYLEKCMIDMYLRYKAYGTIDEFAFWQEQHRLVSEFERFFPDYSIELQKKLEKKYQDEIHKWKNVDIKGFQNFILESKKY